MSNPITILPMGSFQATDQGGLYQFGGQIDATGWKLFGGNVPLLLGAPLGSTTKFLLGNNEVAQFNTSGLQLPTAKGVGIGESPAGKSLVIGSAEPVAELKSGLKLGASPGATLDHYTEGTFTPALVWGSGGGSFTYASQIGRYVRIGKQVSVWCRVVLSAITEGTGILQMTGLPFVSNGAYTLARLGNLLHHNVAQPAGSHYAVCEATYGGNYVQFFSILENATAQVWTAANTALANNASLYVTAVYDTI